MFSIFKTKPLIEFYTDIPVALEHYPPLLSKTNFIETFKKIKISPDAKANIKNCPGIIDYSKTGYIIRTWQDFSIEANNTGEWFEWNAPLNADDYVIKNINFKGVTKKEIDFFNKEIFFEHFPRPNTLQTVLKFSTPWYVNVPKGYKVLLLPVWYDNETRFSVIPGLLDTQLSNNINVQVYWHTLGKKEILKAGTPLVKIVPVKDEEYDHVFRLITDKEHYKLKSYLYKLSNVFR